MNCLCYYYRLHIIWWMGLWVRYRYAGLLDGLYCMGNGITHMFMHWNSVHVCQRNERGIKHKNMDSSPFTEYTHDILLIPNNMCMYGKCVYYDYEGFVGSVCGWRCGVVLVVGSLHKHILPTPRKHLINITTVYSILMGHHGGLYYGLSISIPFSFVSPLWACGGERLRGIVECLEHIYAHFYLFLWNIPFVG